MVAVGEFKSRAAAGHKGAERRAEAAQPLQPDRAGRRQPSGELRHLAPVLVRGTENPAGKHGAVGRAEQPGAHRIGPEIRVPSVDHSQTGSALVACTASLGSPTPRNWNSALFIVVTWLTGWALAKTMAQISAAKR